MRDGEPEVTRMRWAFWRRRRRVRPAPDGVATQPGPAPAPLGTGRPTAADDEDDEPRRRRTRSSGAVPDAAVPDLSSVPARTWPQPDAADLACVPIAGTMVLATVRAVLAGDPVAARAAVLPLDVAAPQQQRAAVAVVLRLLAARIAAGSGTALRAATDPAPLDAVERSALIAYAELLAGRAEPLRGRAAPDLTRADLRAAARLASGFPESDDRLRPFLQEPVPAQVLAAGVVLAQSCLDGLGDVAALADELAHCVPPA